jgi:cell wall-associated NlpC family hydrolase
MTESKLRNLDYGPQGSLGLFQQRSSQSWGTPAQIMQPAHAAREFYQHLLAVPGWQQLLLTQAAQAVQRSKYPGAYAKWQAAATAVLARVTGSEVQACMTYAGAPNAVAKVIAYARAQIGKPYLWGGTGPGSFDCSGLVMMAYRSAGIDIPRTSQEQWAWGPQVPASQAQPGDLVFFVGADGTWAAPGHVGLVIGGGRMIEAYSTGFPIRISDYIGRASVGFTRPWAHHG